jgi:hypothetical protein
MNFTIRNRGFHIGWAGRSLRLLLCAASLAALIIVAAAPAPSAAAPAPQATAPAPRLAIIQQSSAYDSNAIKSVALSCPTGLKTIGGGGQISGPTGNVALLGVMPNATLTNVTVTASEVDGGTSSSWYLNAYAICSALSGTRSLQLVSATTPKDSSNLKTAIANCPAGTELVGVMGGVTTSAYGKIAFAGARPDFAPYRVVAQGKEVAGGTTASWSLTAHALCQSAGSLPGLERVSEISLVNSASKGVVVRCPDDKKLISTSAGVWNTNGNGAGEMVIGMAFPYTDLKGAFAYALETSSGTSSDWFATAYAICVRG